MFLEKLNSLQPAGIRRRIMPMIGGDVCLFHYSAWDNQGQV